MENYIPQVGDIFLCDSDRVGARIVKFLMQSPTLWQQIWRTTRGTLEPVRFYHAGMVISPTEIIEQQGKVQIAPLDKILSRKIIIYRYKKLDLVGKNYISYWAKEDLGEGYGIYDVFAKTLTWLTGIKWFTVFIGKHTINEHICINRIAYWWYIICTFGIHYSLNTTKIVDEYCQSHPEEWEVVYQNGLTPSYSTNLIPGSGGMGA